ncbi:MAG: homocysteine S-methyltransferase family protein [Terracidiphilus sp.]
MNQLFAWIEREPLITDGAWGTQLQAQGLAVGVVPDTWNLTHPERVETVARSYVEAGSQVILTNTFRANRIAMEGCSEADLDRINRTAVALSRRASKDVLIFASIGPSGKMLLADDIGPEEMAAAFLAQAQSLAAGGADALLIETMSDIEEARLAVNAARETGLPVLVSFAFGFGKNKDRTMMGAIPEDVARAMEETGADAVGANCGVGIEGIVSICKRMRQTCTLPIWIKPNAGSPIVEGLSTRYEMSAEHFASHYTPLRKAGAAFLGGCCGTTPEFIGALVKAKSELPGSA